MEWLANSILQDNRPYRRSQADRIIGQIETGLGNYLTITVFSESALSIPSALAAVRTLQAQGSGRR